MKNFMLCFLAVITLCAFYTENIGTAQTVGGMSQNAKTDSTIRRYAIKSAIISFENEVDGLKSFVAMCFDDFGAKEAVESKSYIRQGSHYEQTHTLEINIGDTLYWLNLEQRAGIQTQNKNANSDRPDFSALTPQMMQALGLVRNEPEELLGRMCNVYVIHNERTNIHGKYWVWNNIVLKSDINANGIISTTRAVSIRENIVIPEKNFEVPLDIIPEEID